MNGNTGRGRSMLAVWVAAVGTVVLAVALGEWLCPEAPYGYQMGLWLLFLVTPVVYTVHAWREGSVDGRH